jgi:hypothetical protein
VGRTFADAVLGFDTSSIMGLFRTDGTVSLNPGMQAVIMPGDKLIALSADDDTVVLSDAFGTIASPTSSTLSPSDDLVEHLLFVGWNDLGPMILEDLGDHLDAGSSLDVLVDPELLDPELVGAGGVPPTIDLTVTSASVRNSRPMEAALAAKTYSRVVILCYGGEDPAEADALALLSLIQLRQAISHMPPGYQAPTVVTELRDQRDVELARLSGADDFVVSDRLTSLMLAQLAENPQLDVVFTDLFDAGGGLISTRPAREYVTNGHAVPYRDVVAAGCQRGEIVLGYRKVSGEGAGVVTNPDKRTSVTFTDTDEVIVLADDGALAASAAQ